VSFAVLVLGGYGLFGKRVCALLLRHTDCHVWVAGRRLQSAAAFCATLSDSTRVNPIAIDAESSDLLAQLQTIRQQHSVGLIIHCAGPFQHQDYTVAYAAIAAGLHYIDLADGREFVRGITTLDSAARAANVVVLSGASSVPALSSAVIQELALGVNVSHIDIGISPGNRTERGLATMRAILGYAGEQIPGFRAGQSKTALGWQNLRRHTYAKPAGRRWLADCDVPDLTLLPALYPHLRSLRFGAGLELSVLHLGLYVLAVLRRLHLLPNLAHFASPMKTISEWFLPLGSEVGAMHVHVSGTDNHQKVFSREWQLIAEGGDGPYVPAAASVAITQAILRGALNFVGAKPAVQMLPLADLMAVLDGLAIRTESSF
jgi:hypothetical protein